MKRDEKERRNGNAMDFVTGVVLEVKFLGLETQISCFDKPEGDAQKRW